MKKNIKNIIYAFLFCFLQQANAQCDLPVESILNTGSNHTILMLDTFFTNFPELESVAFIVAVTESGLVVGSASVDGGAQDIAVWGDDPQTPLVDGALADDTILFQLVNGLELYEILTDQILYTTNSFNSLSTASLNLICAIDQALGCTDETALNYNADANTDDESCIAVVNGCTDETALNYNAEANTDDGSCLAVVNGCTDETALNYNAEANTDDESCIAVVNGCTDETALKL